MRRSTARGLDEASRLGLPAGSSVLGCPLCGATIHVTTPIELKMSDLPIRFHDGSAVVSRLGEAAASEAEDACLEHLSVRHPFRLQLWLLTGWRWTVRGIL